MLYYKGIIITVGALIVYQGMWYLVEEFSTDIVGEDVIMVWREGDVWRHEIVAEDIEAVYTPKAVYKNTHLNMLVTNFNDRKANIEDVVL